MKVMQGDLLELGEAGVFDVIVHGANCQCVMGKGIAKGVRAKFPEAYEVDRATEKGDRAKLGTITWAKCGELVVVNAYTQFDYRGAGRCVDYDAVRSCMREIRDAFGGLRIGYPRIGAGFGGRGSAHPMWLCFDGFA